MIGSWLNFIIPVQKFGVGALPQNWEPKPCKISVDVIQPQTLIANISGTTQDIQNRKDYDTSACIVCYATALVKR